jgi:hypothetical protein
MMGTEGELVSRKPKPEASTGEESELEKQIQELERKQHLLELQRRVRQLEGSLITQEEIDKHNTDMSEREYAVKMAEEQARTIIKKEHAIDARLEQANKVVAILEAQVSRGKLSHYPSFYDEVGNEAVLALLWAVMVIIKNRGLTIPRWDLDADAERIGHYKV